VAATGVLPGLEVLLRDSAHLVRDRRVGLITNHTGVTREGQHAVDYLRAGGVNLVALFGPEHGVRGDVEAGLRIEHGRDPESGIPVYSLYGQTQRPTPEMLRDVEVLLFDIQDIGARPYTYIYTMALGMEAARENGIPFLVLDRPNPINGVVIEGNLLDTAFATFVGMYPIPIRHGMTAGELAQLFNQEFGIGADLTVVPVRGWRREMWGDQTGQPWINPSPNIRRLEAAIHYPGTVFFEGTNLSTGRGSEMPFEQIGAPWLRADEIVHRMNALQLAGLRFERVDFTPRDPGDGKFADEPVRGVRLIVTDREAYRPVTASLLLISAIRQLHPAEFAWRVAHFDRLAGTDALRLAIEHDRLTELLREWEREAEQFREFREPFLLYR
jgi:uncharacterized protein YbbC (DUF1343 family)